MNKPPSLVIDNISRFTGRRWVLSSLTSWIEDLNQHSFLITSEPGAGKTSLVALLGGAGDESLDTSSAGQLRRFRNLVKATHFCVTRERGSLSPRMLATSLADQLCRTVEGFAEALIDSLPNNIHINVTQQNIDAPGGRVTGITIDRLNLTNLNGDEAFNVAVRNPLQKVFQAGVITPIVLIIDALDEAQAYDGEFKIAQLLSGVDDLPPNVRLLLTTRPDPRILKLFPHTPKLDLVDDIPTDEDDIKEYALEYLPSKLIAEHRNNAAARLSEAAEGNFLYAFLVLRDLAPILEPSAWEFVRFPKGLSGLYNEFLNRELGVDEEKWATVYAPLLGLISISRGEGLSRSRLDKILGQSMQYPLRACAQYLNSNSSDGPFRIFHQSFADFLLKDDSNINYRIEIETQQELHLRILSSYGTKEWQDLPADDAYILKNLVYHLINAGHHFEAERLFQDSRWFHKRFQADNYEFDGYIDDLMTVWEVTEKEHLALQLKDKATPSSLVNCIRNALIRTSVNSIAANYSPALVAKALEVNYWTAERALGIVKLVPNPINRINCFVALVGTGKFNAEQKELAIRGAVDALSTISDWKQIIEALRTLSSNLDGALLEQASDIAVGLPEIVGKLPSGDDESKTKKERDFDLAAGLVSFMFDPPRSPRAEGIAVLSKQLHGDVLFNVSQVALRLPPEILGLHKEPKSQASPEMIMKDRPRAMAISSLAHNLSDNRDAFVLVLSETLKIEDEFERFLIIASCCEFLPKDLLYTLGQQLISSFSNERYRQSIHAQLTQLSLGYLPDEKIPEVFQALQNETNEFFRLGALLQLTPRLSEVNLLTMLDLAFQMERPELRDYIRRVLEQVINRVSSSTVISRCLTAANDTKDDTRRRDILVVISTYFSEEQIQSAWEIAKKISNENLRIEAQIALAPVLPRSLLSEALRIALSTKGGTRAKLSWALESVRDDRGLAAALLTAITPKLTDELTELALDRGLKIENQAWKTKLLIALAPKFSPQLLERVKSYIDALPIDAQLDFIARLPVSGMTLYIQQSLRSLLDIRPEKEVTLALMHLVKSVPSPDENVLEFLLEAAKNTDDEQGRTDTLIKIGSQIPQSLSAKAFDSALSISDESKRFQAFEGLSSAFTSQDLERVVRLALKTGSSAFRHVGTLMQNAGSIPSQQLLHDLLEMAKREPSEYNRYQLLSGVFPHVNSETISNALDFLSGFSQDSYTLALLCLINKDILITHLANLQVGGNSFTPTSNAQSIAEQFTSNDPHLDAITGTFWGLYTSKIPRAKPHIDILQQYISGLRVDLPESTALFLERLERTLLNRIVLSALGIEDSTVRIRVLRILHELLKEITVDELKDIIGYRTSAYWKRRIADLAENLESDTKEQALKFVLEHIFEETDLDYKLLESISKSMSKSLLEKAIEAAVQEADRDNVLHVGNPRARALGALAPNLDGELVQRTYEAAMGISNVHWKTYVLSRIGKRMTNVHLISVLNMLSEYEDEHVAFTILEAIGGQLKDELRVRGLELARAIRNPAVRAASLTALLTDNPLDYEILKDIYTSIASQLMALQTQPRSHVLSFLSLEAPFSPVVIPSELAHNAALQVVKVCRDWNWLP